MIHLPAPLSGPRVAALRRGALAGLLFWAVGLALDPAAATAQPGDSLAVAARELARGTVLTAEDIAYAGAAEVARAAGAANGERVGPGWVTRRVVREGEVLRPPAVAPPRLVRAGEPVQGRVRLGALEVRVWGEAMNDAAEGETVHLRTADGRRFSGTASDVATVTLQLRDN